MRIITSLVLALSLGVSACATGPRAVNVASVRHEINDTIQAQQADRTVTSMGKVTTERAVVYTTSKAGTRQEETWVKDGANWKLDKSSAMNN
jgi:hypothetical protein